VIRSLHIENYVLIDSLDITFPEGLAIITGQTGAGKSILLGALSLLLGAKADASCISEGAENCVVEAEFDTGDRIVRRVVSRSGRSRCFVDDCPVQAAELSELVASLVDIHSQHKSLLLTDAKFQLLMLDKFAAHEDVLEQCRLAYKEAASIRSELEALKQTAGKADAEQEYARAQYRQLEAAKLRSGELEELEEEQKTLANAEEIKETLGRVGSLFSADADGAAGVDLSLKEASRSLSKIREFLPSAESLIQRIDSARIELADVLSEIETEDSKVSVSGDRLEAVENRMSELYSLMKKHSCASVEELIALKEQYASGFEDSESRNERIEQLARALEAKEKEYDTLSEKLRAGRKKAAEKFAAEIVETLHFLELERADFKIALSESAPSASGRDSVAFLFSAGGTQLADISKAASGGELSRIMLSLKAMMARFTGMPTMIFDEIDTGVSGSVADKMGQIICEMGRTMQVLAITHLPQVAAKGREHFLVSKTISDGVAKSSITRLDEEGRVNEIARLLSGSSITPEAIANAKSLLRGN